MQDRFVAYMASGQHEMRVHWLQLLPHSQQHPQSFSGDLLPHVQNFEWPISRRPPVLKQFRMDAIWDHADLIRRNAAHFK